MEAEVDWTVEATEGAYDDDSPFKQAASLDGRSRLSQHLPSSPGSSTTEASVVLLEDVGRSRLRPKSNCGKENEGPNCGKENAGPNANGIGKDTVVLQSSPLSETQKMQGRG